MNIKDSVNVKNRVKTSTIIIAAIVYLYLTAITFGFALIPLIISVLIARHFIKKETKTFNSHQTEFRKNQFPLKYFGQAYGEFQHVFYHEKNLTKEMLNSISRQLTLKTPVHELKPINICDMNNELITPDVREFYIGHSDHTKHGTSMTLVMKCTKYGKMQSFQWWVLAGGYIDKNKIFQFMAYSLFTTGFWLIPLFKKDFDLLSKIRTVYSSSYNYSDIITQSRCLHDAVFNSMIENLENNGIDTSDLKAQRMQVMNINVSGGKVTMGNVIQGAKNQVKNSMKGVTS